jgi:DNA-binding NtrC family response regulator
MLLAEGALVPELARWFEASAHGVPPLRERPEDLESLLLLALDRAARVLGKPAKGVEASALEVLLDYHWPGNDAELLSVIERAVEQADGPRIGRDDLPPLALEQVGAAGSSFVEQERAILRRALRRAGGNHTAAAKTLGLRRAELIEKLGQLELEDKSSAEN